jgi:hypothetical protein
VNTRNRDSGRDWTVNAETEVAVILGYLKKLFNVRNSSLDSKSDNTEPESNGYECNGTVSEVRL